MTDKCHPGINLGIRHGEAHQHAEKVMFGFWVFLMSDLVLFGVIFATYVTTVTPMGIAGGPGPADVFDLKSVFIQTMLLLTSSLTFGIATLMLRHEMGIRNIVLWLCVTLGLGLGFLTLELRDFATMFTSGAVPSRSGFLSAFFALVPLHGLHVAAGAIWIVVMLAQVAIFGLIPMVKTRLLRLALFWHFLDVIWIAIFSIVYLGGLA